MNDPTLYRLIAVEFLDTFILEIGTITQRIIETISCVYNRSPLRTVKRFMMGIKNQGNPIFCSLFNICLFIAAVFIPSQNVLSQNQIPSDKIPRHLKITIESKPIGFSGAETRHIIRKDRSVEVSGRGGLYYGISGDGLMSVEKRKNGKFTIMNPTVSSAPRLPKHLSKSNLRTILSNLRKLNLTAVGERPVCKRETGGPKFSSTHYTRKTIFVRFGDSHHLYSVSDACGPLQNQEVTAVWEQIFLEVQKVSRETVIWDAKTPPTQIALIQDARLRNGKIPNDLEIIVENSDLWHGGSSQKRSTVRSDRRIEYSYSCVGCLPVNTTNLLDLLSIVPATQENRLRQEKEKARRDRTEKKRIASLRAIVPKSTIKRILSRFRDSGFFDIEPESMWCKAQQHSPTRHTRRISIEYEGFSRKLEASEGCELDGSEKTEQRKQFLALHDFILASLKHVRRDEVPWRSDIERKLRRSMEDGELPGDFEIIAESDEGGLGSRLRLDEAGILTKSSYSTRATIVIEGAEATSWDKRNQIEPRKAPRLKKRVPKQNTISVLESFLSSDFFEMAPILRGDFYLSGPAKYTSISFRLNGLTKQTRCETYCRTDTAAPCAEFCSLFEQIKQSAAGVKSSEVPW